MARTLRTLKKSTLMAIACAADMLFTCAIRTVTLVLRGLHHHHACMCCLYNFHWWDNHETFSTTGRILAFPVSRNVPETMMKCYMFFMWLSNFLFKNWCDFLQIFLCIITAVQGGISYRISFMNCVPAK